MTKQILLLDRVEFTKISVEANSGSFLLDKTFPQLAVDPEGVEVLTRSDLLYPPDQLEDPRVFVLIYGVKISSDAEGNGIRNPYNIEVEAAGYFRYVGGDEFSGEHRFRAVRFSGYQILYGAIREMVSNVTARAKHGLWHLPARNFGRIAELRGKEDEARRQAQLAQQAPHAEVASLTRQGDASSPAPKTRAKKPKR